MKIKAATAFVDLGFKPTDDQPKCLTSEKFHYHMDRMVRALGKENFRVFDNFPFQECWAVKEFYPRVMTPASPTPSDRFASREQHALCNYVQHERSPWALRASVEQPDVDVWIWLDSGVLKQGGNWTGKQCEEKHVVELFDKVHKNPPVDVIPFPGIRARYPIDDRDQHWRFVGSTHIWPAKFLPAIVDEYKIELRKFVLRNNTIPGDLPIWGYVEQKDVLPFRFYQGEYDYTQMTGYPDPDVPWFLRRNR